jgi:hypothetical protein
MKRRQILLPAMTFAAAALGAACAYAEDAKPIVIETKADPRVPNGTLADLSGFTDDKGPLMKLEGLSIFQPVFVTIVSGDVATHLRVKISKPDGQDIIFEGATGEKGSVAAKFRSQGEAWIKVTSPGGRKKFSIIAWVGDIVPPRIQSALRPIP